MGKLEHYKASHSASHGLRQSNPIQWISADRNLAGHWSSWSGGSKLGYPGCTASLNQLRTLGSVPIKPRWVTGLISLIWAPGEECAVVFCLSPLPASWSMTSCWHPIQRERPACTPQLERKIMPQDDSLPRSRATGPHSCIVYTV